MLAQCRSNSLDVRGPLIRTHQQLRKAQLNRIIDHGPPFEVAARGQTSRLQRNLERCRASQAPSQRRTQGSLRRRPCANEAELHERVGRHPVGRRDGGRECHNAAQGFRIARHVKPSRTGHRRHPVAERRGIPAHNDLEDLVISHPVRTRTQEQGNQRPEISTPVVHRCGGQQEHVRPPGEVGECRIAPG